MTTQLRHPARGFTLVELIAVITIIILLAGLVVGGISYVRDRQDREKAKIQIALLSKAIEEYKLDMGVYPPLDIENTPADGDISEELYQALFYEGYEASQSSGAAASADKATKIYLAELDPTTSKQGWVEKNTTGTPGPELKIVDPWGNPYYYRKGSNAENPDFDLWSAGKDGKTNPSNPDLSEEDNRDDVRNY
jgi:general secretion pathway protein G